MRDRFTLTLDATFLTYGWFLYSFSPAVPLLADEHGISRAVAGLHGTALAVGTVLAGLVSERLVRAFGRKALIIGGAVTVTLGIGVLLVAPGLAGTLAGCVVAAAGGTATLAASQPALLEHHGPAGPAAVTIGNGYGTAVGLLAPLVLGVTVAAGWGWRPALALTIVAAVVSIVLVAALPGTGALSRPSVVADHDAPARLGPVFWLLMVAVVVAVAVEFSTTFWASELIAERTGAPTGLATGLVAALLAGMTLSRLVIGVAGARVAPVPWLLAGYAVAVVGWYVLWQATEPWQAGVGLFVAGLGYGTHYPLALSLVVAAAGPRPDLGAARATLGAGLASGLAPFVLGALADAVGARTAFVAVPVLAVVAAVALTVVLRTSPGRTPVR